MSSQIKASLDDRTTQDFGSRLLRDNAAAVRAAMNYIGDKLGLFKALHKAGPVTVEELARQTNMNARYLQEWLAAMVSAEYVQYDPDQRTYLLPAEQAAYLADEDSPMFSGSMFEMTKALWEVVEPVSQCFTGGGGVPHSAQSPDMDHATERYSRQFFRFHLTQEWIPRVQGLEQRLKDGAQIADVGCGIGQSVLTMAKAYPLCQVWGYDNYAPVIEKAKKTAQALGLKNAHFQADGAEDIGRRHTFDFVTTFDVIHDMSDPVAGLRSIHNLLKPDGFYMMVEMNVSDRLEENINPFASMLYSISTLYCMTVSLAENGAGIGACMGERRARELAKEAGFHNFTRIDISYPFASVYVLKP